MERVPIAPDDWGEDWDTGGGRIYTECGPWEVEEQVKPLTQAWWQSSPFNDEAPLIDGERALAGCVAVACAELLSAHRYPSHYGDARVDWGWMANSVFTLTDEQRHEAALLLRAIGDKLENDWGTSSTGANAKDVPKLLEDMGYAYPGALSDYNGAGGETSVRHGRPVICSGANKEKGWWICKFHDDGHAWVIDGFNKLRRRLSVRSTRDSKEISHSYEYSTLVHCNWGWGKGFNGY